MDRGPGARRTRQRHAGAADLRAPSVRPRRLSEGERAGARPHSANATEPLERRDAHQPRRGEREGGAGRGTAEGVEAETGGEQHWDDAEAGAPRRRDAVAAAPVRIVEDPPAAQEDERQRGRGGAGRGGGREGGRQQQRRGLARRAGAGARPLPRARHRARPSAPLSTRSSASLPERRRAGRRSPAVSQRNGTDVGDQRDKRQNPCRRPGSGARGRADRRCLARPGAGQGGRGSPPAEAAGREPRGDGRASRRAPEAC